MALAIDSLCFSPPDKRVPFSPIIALYFVGKFSINSSAAARLQASNISSFVAS